MPGFRQWVLNCCFVLTVCMAAGFAAAQEQASVPASNSAADRGDITALGSISNSNQELPAARSDDWLDLPEPFRLVAFQQQETLQPLSDDFAGSQRPGFNFFTEDRFENAFRIPDTSVYLKPGGYVKTDFIYDFKPIDDTDAFDVTTIPTDAPDRTNARFHARQTRLNLDARWFDSERGNIRFFVEGDFFGENNTFRLRHAFTEVGNFHGGQTWTTFTDILSSPQTLDTESPVAFVTRRQAQARFTYPLIGEELTFAVAVEDPTTIFDLPSGLAGEPRTPLPDFITRLRLVEDWGRIQIAGLVRELGFQPEGADVVTGLAWGVNLTGSVNLTENNLVSFQLLTGEGTGSYRNLPDVVPAGPDSIEILQSVAWMVGITHAWNEDTASSIIYSRSRLYLPEFLSGDELKLTEYFAVNVIRRVFKNVDVGAELLYGTRVDADGDAGSNIRLQFSGIFNLP